MKCNALILGCGNIGAGYDLKDDARVWTHAKAFSKIPAISFAVADAEPAKAKKIAALYGVKAVPVLPAAGYSNYQLVSITTPTNTHASFLEKLVQQKVPVVICEKPVAATLEELNRLSKIYKKGETKILVNYIRRFQRSYASLQQWINKKAGSSCTGINIKYQRGFLNNATHAFDLLEFLFNKPFLLTGFKVQKAVFDAFDYDPTVSGSCDFYGCPVTMIGIENAAYPIFEIELYFNTQKVVICHSGDDIRFYQLDKGTKKLVENSKLRKTGILAQYMMPVVQQALKMLNDKAQPDNFLPALELNKRAVKVISDIRKNKQHG